MINNLVNHSCFESIIVIFSINPKVILMIGYIKDIMQSYWEGRGRSIAAVIHALELLKFISNLVVL